MQKIEDFPNYAPFLTTEVWPGSTGERSPVMDMAPQHAASALAKLVRWAVSAPQGTLTLLSEIGLREEYVRRAPLGRALAARAQNLQPGEDVVFRKDSAPADTVRSTIAAAVVELIPAAAGIGANAIAEVIYHRLTLRWEITEAA
jgi:hypothetical protein